MFRQGIFHLGASDIFASPDNDVLGAILDDQKAVFIKQANITGVEPAIPDGVCRFPGSLPVSFHHCRALDADFACLAMFQDITVGVFNADLCHGLCRATGTFRLCQVKSAGNGGANGIGFCQPVTQSRLDDRIEFFLHHGQVPRRP